MIGVAGFAEQESVEVNLKYPSPTLAQKVLPGEPATSSIAGSVGVDWLAACEAECDSERGYAIGERND